MRQRIQQGPRRTGGAMALAMACLLLAFSSGCEDKAPAAADKAPAPVEELPVASEHQPEQVAQATRQVGEGCDKGGASECRSGICLRTGPDPYKGHFCSVQCGDDSACPRTWRCIQLHPSAGGRACMPPEGWTGAVAEPR